MQWKVYLVKHMKRNYGIDLLRMILMLMIVLLHILGHGGILDAVSPMTGKYAVLWLMEAFAYCAVNCYALISGYVHFGSRYRFSSFGLIYLQALLYSVSLAIVVWLINPASFSLEQLFSFVFPVSRGVYWYLSAYFGLFIMIPFLNAAVNAISKEQARTYLLLAFVVFTILPTLARYDTFRIDSGYSTFWLAFLYVIGACIRKFGWFDSLAPRKAFGVYLLCVLVSWGTKLCFEGITMRLLGTPVTVFYFITYTSPTIVMAAAALFLAFKNAPISPGLSRIAAVFSPAAFGVYLIHDHDAVSDFFIVDRFGFLAESPLLLMTAGVILSALAVFTVCLLIDWVRWKVFIRLRVKDRLEKLETRFTRLGHFN